MLEDRSTEPTHVFDAVQVGRTNERRDIQRAIKLWQQGVGEDGGAPLLETFDFSPMRTDWGYRFLVCSDQSAENAAFVVYRFEVCAALRIAREGDNQHPR